MTLTEAVKKAGHLDLFSGSRGAAKALARRSGRFVLTFDILHLSDEDLLDDNVRTAASRGCIFDTYRRTSLLEFFSSGQASVSYSRETGGY